MDIEAKFAGREVGYDVPAIPGVSEDEIQTPCLILDLDALERNIRKLGDYARAHNNCPAELLLQVRSSGSTALSARRAL
jgi:hypothetical protein